MEIIKQEEIEQETTKQTKKQEKKEDAVPFVLGSLHETGSSSSETKPKFEQIEVKDVTPEYRKIRVPADRYNALKNSWEQIYTPIVEKMDLQIRMNVKTRHVEIRTCETTKDQNAIQKAADFVQAFLMGFEPDDAMALLRLDDIFLDSFQINEVKNLQGDHLGRAVGRILGKNGSVKFTIENVSKTRIVIKDDRVAIMGSYKNIQVAKNAVMDLIIGSPIGQVYNRLRMISSRQKETF